MQFVQCVSLRLAVETEVMAEWDECCCVCSADCLRLAGGIAVPSQAVPPGCSGALWGSEVLLVVGES